jgi:magnesium transporter
MNLFRKKFRKAGLPPGWLSVPEGVSKEKPELTLFRYNEDSLIEKKITVDELETVHRDQYVGWINVDGLGDINVFETIGKQFGIHDLALEDILNVDQRPKIEEHDGYFLIIIKMIYHNDKDGSIEVEQVSMVLMEHFVLTFQEKPGDVFTSIRERIRNSKGRIRQRGADYLAFALLDAIVDYYFIVFEQLGEQVTECENEVISNPTPATSARIHVLRNKLIALRRAIWPLRDVISELRKSESDLFSDETEMFFRDLYDHAIQIIEAMETYREMLSGLLDGYQNAVSNKMNEIMKILTIISTMFIPLSFLAGVYGMNFKNMPELKTTWGYPVLLGVMLCVAGLLLLFFKRKKWI